MVTFPSLIIFFLLLLFGALTFLPLFTSPTGTKRN
jgi:hypothetical protein